MIELILIMETRSSNKSDYMYIKSTLDYYYEPRTYGIKKIFATTKSLLIKQEKKIEKLCNMIERKPVIIVIADYDQDEPLNDIITKYCLNKSYDLIWMNSDVEEVYLGEKISRKDKEKKAIAFQIKKNKLIPKLNNLSETNPLNKSKSSNILVVLDKHLKRKVT